MEKLDKKGIMPTNPLRCEKCGGLLIAFAGDFDGCRCPKLTFPKEAKMTNKDRDNPIVHSVVDGGCWHEWTAEEEFHWSESSTMETCCSKCGDWYGSDKNPDYHTPDGTARVKEWLLSETMNTDNKVGWYEFVDFVYKENLTEGQTEIQGVDIMLIADIFSDSISVIKYFIQYCKANNLIKEGE